MSGPVSFGRYVLLDKLASGGMAEIFLAKATGEAGFERTCVIKRILPHLVEAPGFVEMFLNEARIAAQLHHPGVAQLFDLGKEGDAYYLAMEYLPGEDLAAILARCRKRGEPMPLDVAARITSTAAEALHYAHDALGPQGKPLELVHRDVSPSNLFITYTGSVKVLDFGIARAGERLDRTQTGHVKGKASYVSPEQVAGGRIDRRSDVWSLGVCLHEMLTGAQLFDRIGYPETLEAVVSAPVRGPSASRREVPAPLDAAVMRAVERDRGKRFPTAMAFREELERYLADRTYVPQSTQLGLFLRQLFGDARADERLRLAASPDRALREPNRPPPLTDPIISSGDKTIIASDGVRRTTRRWPWFALAAAPIAAAIAWYVVPRSPPNGLESTRPEPVPAAPIQADPVLPAPSVVAPPPAEPAPRGAAPHRPKPAGLLTVESNLPAKALLDGNPIGNTPVARLTASPGEHRLLVENASLGVSRASTVLVKEGRETLEHVEFRKGRLNVQVDPWADVWLDDKKLGQTPLAAREVWEGKHALRLVGDHGEKRLSVEVLAGQTAVVKETLPR